MLPFLLKESVKDFKYIFQEKNLIHMLLVYNQFFVLDQKRLIFPIKTKSFYGFVFLFLTDTTSMKLRKKKSEHFLF